MFRFLDFLKEEAKRQEDVHYNPSMSRLKALARNSKYEEARYAIDHEGNVWAGDAHHHVHSKFGHGTDSENTQRHVVSGYIVHHNGNYIHNSFEKSSRSKRASHPFIDKMESRGIINGGKED